MKKLLRSLLEKFQSHKSCIDVLMNFDEVIFSLVVGMMQAFKLEYLKNMEAKTKGVALATKKDEDKTEDIENEIGLIVRKYLKCFDQG